MAQSMEVTIVVDNERALSCLDVEHGLSIWIETPTVRVLFDTGKGGALGPNAAALGIDLCTATAVVLSHGHYDHTGGLSEVLGKGLSAPIYAHPNALCAKYSRDDDGTGRFTGIPLLASGGEAWEECKGRFVPVEGVMHISRGIFATGAIPREAAVETVSASFYRDKELTQNDAVRDDQALFLDTDEGTVVLLGCAHSGVINTLNYISGLTQGRRVHAVIGGMHLGDAGPERIEATVKALKDSGAHIVAPIHCTGERAARMIAEAFGDAHVAAGAGSRFCFDVSAGGASGAV